MAKFCEYCGAPLQEGARFCTGCGHPVAVMSQPTQQQPQQPASQPRPQQQPQGGQQQGYPYGQQQASQQGNPYRQSSNSVNFQPSLQANRPQQPKKKGGCLKAFLVVALIGVLGYGGWEYYQYREAKRIHDELTKDYPEKMEKLRQRQQRQQKQNSIDVDDGPKIVLDGENYKLELPASAKGVECVPVSDEQLAQLEQQGYDFIGRPLFVTCNGKEHVELDRAATVSFDLPKDFPKDKYLDLVGILVTDKGPEYRIPDYFALQEGVVRFKTCHFSPAGYGESPINAREEFINYVALNGWQTNMNNKIFEKTLKQKITEFGNNNGFADDDLFGIAAKKLFSDNTMVQLTGLFVDTWSQRHDENATFENAKTLMKYVGKDLLAASFKKLQEDKATETKILKDIEVSGGEPIPIYKKKLEQIQSRRSKIMEMLSEHLTAENMEKLGTQLGKETSFRECYVMACEYATDFAKGKLKDYATNLCPCLKAVEAVKVGGEIMKEYIASEEARDMWEAYERVAEPDGTIKDDFWNAIVDNKSGAFKTWHNITPEQMRAKFEERYRSKIEIEKRKKEAGEIVDLLTENVDLFSDRLRDYDYVSRLSKVYNLMERFRKELVNKDGIIHGQYGDKGVSSAVNEELCYVVNMYFSFESEEEFYQWLAEKGYLDEQLKKTYDLLDGALWGDEESAAEPVEEPEEEQSEEQGFQLQLDDYFFIQHTEALTQREMNDNGMIGCRYGYYLGEEEKFKAHVVVDGTSFRIEMPEIKHVRNSDKDYDEFNISGYTVSGAFLPPEKLKVKNIVGIYTDVIYFSPSTLHYKAKYHYESMHCERRDNCIITLSEVEEEILPTKQACFGFEFVNDQFKSVKTVFVRFPVTLSRRYTTTCFNETNLTHDGEGFVEIQLMKELPY